MLHADVTGLTHSSNHSEDRKGLEEQQKRKIEVSGSPSNPNLGLWLAGTLVMVINYKEKPELPKTGREQTRQLHMWSCGPQIA